MFLCTCPDSCPVSFFASFVRGDAALDTLPRHAFPGACRAYFTHNLSPTRMNHAGAPDGFFGGKPLFLVRASRPHDSRRDAGATIFRRLAASLCATADCDRFLLHRPSPAFSSANGSDLVSRLREEHLSRCGLPASGNL